LHPLEKNSKMRTIVNPHRHDALSVDYIPLIVGPALLLARGFGGAIISAGASTGNFMEAGLCAKGGEHRQRSHTANTQRSEARPRLPA
jgi:hypothetical protein